ncbi:hypothetical protein HanIR_Chr09g0396591 [Helianthus annuus]|nr:hypothetical protein HanIR_Chr09g0396591 [Helianthus annuus]
MRSGGEIEKERVADVERFSGRPSDVCGVSVWRNGPTGGVSNDVPVPCLCHGGWHAKRSDGDNGHNHH